MKARLVKAAKSQGPPVVVSVVFKEMAEASIVGRRNRVARSREIILENCLVDSVSVKLIPKQFSLMKVPWSHM